MAAMLDTIIEEIHAIQFEASIYSSFARPALWLAAVGFPKKSRNLKNSGGGN
jgi:hypothetical protein